jgi:sarcosine oxidase subunit beta
MSHHDAIVIGAGVIGCSVAYHLARLGAARVLVLERSQIGAGTSAQSSGILRTHYSVAENVALAQASWAAFADFAAYVGDDEASAGMVQCGYLICSPEGPRLDALRGALAGQQARGIEVRLLDRAEAHDLLPIARFDDAALIGYEPLAGFADAYLTATSFARAARRLGVTFLEGVRATGLLREGERIVGVETTQGRFSCATLVSTQNIWAREIERWTGIASPVSAERHAVLALQADAEAAYTTAMPVFKDLASPGMLYYRSYGGRQMLASEGTAGEVLDEPTTEQGAIPDDQIIAVGEQVAARFPAYAQAGLASSWTGVYDVTPDWNPVLGRPPGLDGLVVGYGFSGHGFKLSPAVGRVLAQEALGMPTEVSLEPYALERFSTGRLLTGRYGVGAVS